MTISLDSKSSNSRTLNGTLWCHPLWSGLLGVPCSGRVARKKKSQNPAPEVCLFASHHLPRKTTFFCSPTCALEATDLDAIRLFSLLNLSGESHTSKQNDCYELRGHLDDAGTKQSSIPKKSTVSLITHVDMCACCMHRHTHFP